MTAVIFIFLCLGVFTLFLSILRVRQFLRNLTDAVRSKHHFLKIKPTPLLKLMRLEKLMVEVNRLIDSHNEYADVQSNKLKQLEATLGSIQEAVIIFNDESIIEYANASARQLFSQSGTLKGLRLESALRSPDLIDLASANPNDRSSELKQICIERQGQWRWFELSFAEVRKVSEADRVSTLLVLHDISRLKSLEEIRRDFVANVSHELRTPITIIKGYVETLLEDNLSLTAEKRMRFLEKIEKSTHRLHLLVEDLLELSRLESKPNQIELSMGSLQQLLEDIIDDYQSRLDSKKQKIVLDFDSHVGEFAFDRFRVQQVYDNLVENVFSYAPGFTRLEFKVQYDEATDRVQCTVSDDGPGIPEKDLPHVFERFYRVDKGRSYESGGTGLGLSIMKHIIQQHGGSVLAESEPGKGTAIHFFLPYAKVGDDR